MRSNSVVPDAGRGDRATRWLRPTTVLVFAAAAAYYVAVSWRWRIMVDSSIMHYVIFLMRHGLRPYAEISDNNMPGAYFVEALGMRVFGLGDLGWRLFEFTLLGVLAAALIRIARRWDATAGVFAAGMFLVLHSAEGAQYAAERELTLTVLLVLGYVCLFHAVERDRPPVLLLFGLLSGLAASIKPTFLPLPLALLAVAAFVVYRQHGRPIAACLYALCGMGFVFSLDLAWLLHEHALEAFHFILTAVLPAYVGLAKGVSMAQLVPESLPKLAFPLLVVLPFLIWANWRGAGRWDWQRWTLTMGAAFGLLSFLLQRKGFLHHRYTLLVFFYLIVGLEIFQALKRPGWARPLAAGTLLFSMFVSVPRTLRFTHTAVGHSDLELALEGDLKRMGGAPALQRKVQCFDLVFGCLDALYHQRIVENSGFTGDLLFFPLHDSVATEYYRDRFWRGARTDPAEIIVVSNQNLTGINDFGKLGRWPEFASWLHAHYTPVVERHFTFEHLGGRYQDPVKFPEQDAYRVYIRNGSPVLPGASSLQATKANGQS